MKREDNPALINSDLCCCRNSLDKAPTPLEAYSHSQQFHLLRSILFSINKRCSISYLIKIRWSYRDVLAHQPSVGTLSFYLFTIAPPSPHHLSFHYHVCFANIDVNERWCCFGVAKPNLSPQPSHSSLSFRMASPSKEMNDMANPSQPFDILR